MRKAFVRLGRCATLSLLAVAISCDQSATGPHAAVATDVQAGTNAQIPPDPCPTCNGHWIGYDAEECVTALTDDQDSDGLRDTCERRFAEFFRPYLVMSAADQTKGHEPYWAARFDGNNVTLFWAFGFFFDGGTANQTAWYCYNPLRYVFEDWTCSGHPGDSESLVLNLAYNPGTQHWELASLSMSRHGSYSTAVGTQVSYNGPYLGYPTVYVAFGKHASYLSDYQCDSSGGFGDSDECYSDYYLRDFFSAYRNLGSSADQLINCVQGASGYSECFWATTGHFRGWTGLQPEVNVAQYGNMLLHHGF